MTDFGLVVGRVMRASAAHLPQSTPVRMPMRGRVIFRPSAIGPVSAGDPRVHVARETVTAYLDGSTGLLHHGGQPGVWLAVGVWEVSWHIYSGEISPMSIVVTAEHTEDSPLDLATVAPWEPPPGVTVHALVVPSGIPAGDVLIMDGTEIRGVSAATFRGEDGRDGRDGADGRDGIDGQPGRDGSDGAPGRDGQDGQPGRDGQDGQPGRDGSDGPAGPTGPAGPPGRDGIEGPAGQDGSDGVGITAIARVDTSAVVTLTDGSTQIFELPEGPEGPRGPQGDRGPQGEPGESATAADTDWLDGDWAGTGLSVGFFARYCRRAGTVWVALAAVTVSSDSVHLRMPEGFLPDYWAINTVSAPCMDDAGNVVGKATWWDQSLDDRRLEIKCPAGEATPAFSVLFSYPVARS